MKISFVPSSRQEHPTLFASFQGTLHGSFDSYMEEQYLASACYAIYVDDELVGCLLLHSTVGITQFHLVPSHRRYEQMIFASAIKELSITEAFFPTCDIALLILCLDLQAKVVCTAYNFSHGGQQVAKPTFGHELLHLATKADLDDLVASEFLDRPAEQVEKGRIYVMRKEQGEFMGLGIIEQSVLYKDHASIGMYVVPSFRKQGVGRSILLHLVDVCRQKKIAAIAGCAYDNHASKSTLESVGFLATTRLVRADLR